MTADESPMSLFSSGGKKGSGKIKKNSPKEPTAAAPRERTSKRDDNKQFLDPEVYEMLTRMREMRGDIDGQVEELSRRTGLSKEQLWQLAHDPKLIDASLIKAMQSKNEQLINEVVSIRKGENSTSSESTAQQPNVRSKSRSGKLIGSRRKWIPIR